MLSPPEKKPRFKVAAILFILIMAASATLGMYLGATPTNSNKFYPGGLSLATGGEGFSIGGDTVLSRSAANTWSTGSGDSFNLQGALQINGTTVTDLLEYPELAASYVVWVDGGVYYAKNGHTGAVTSGADAVILLQAIVDSMTITTGSLFFKVGEYTFTDTLSLSSGIALLGETVGYNGVPQTTRFTLGNNICKPIIDLKGEAGGRTYDITLRDIWFYGNNLNQPTESDLVDLSLGTYSNVEHCNFINARRVGLITYSAWVNKCYFLDCEAAGLSALTDTWATNNYFANCMTNSSISTGVTGQIYLAGNLNQIIGNYVELSSNGTGINFFGASNNIISNNIVYSNYLIGIYGFNSENNTIIGNLVYDNSQYGVGGYPGIRVGGSNNIISGNRVYGDKQEFGIIEQTGPNLVYGNDLTGNIAPANITGVGTKAYGNIGYVTENSGTSVVASGATTSVVAHGLSYTPTAANTAWTVTPTEVSTNDAGPFAVTMMNATHVTFSVLRDPGASNLDFSWASRRVP